jgi:hypothetical protein
MILFISMVECGDVSGAKFWLPLRFKFIGLECFYQNEHFNSVVIEGEAILKRIEVMAFSRTSLEFVTILASVWSEVMNVNHFLQSHLNQSREYRELKIELSLKPIWLRLLFLLGWKL